MRSERTDGYATEPKNYDVRTTFNEVNDRIGEDGKVKEVSFSSYSEQLEEYPAPSFYWFGCTYLGEILLYPRARPLLYNPHM